MFQGRTTITIDPVKGRTTLPTKLRHAFVTPEGNHLTMTRHPQGCLLIFPRASWLVKKQAILQLPITASAWKRMFVGNATDIEIDDSGRILIPAELRKPVGLEKEAMLVGMGDHLELWDVSTLEKNESELTTADVPPELANFIL